MSIYTSQGTIRIRCDIDASGGNDCKATIYFVPENDYSIKHRNDKYAVFVPQSCDCKPQSWRNTLIRKYNPDRGDEIEIDAAGVDRMDIISFAAMHQKKVEVEVEMTLSEREISEVASKIVSEIPEDKDGNAKKEAVKKVLKKLGKVVEGRISKVASKIVKKIAKDEDGCAKKEAIEQVLKATLQCFKLTGITIPAQ